MIRDLIIAAVCCVVGWYARGYLDMPVSAIEAEIVAHQEVCADDTPSGYASYPVTHWGELRGCLRVKVDSPAWLTSPSMFVRKVRP